MNLIVKLAARFNPYRRSSAITAIFLLILISTAIKFELLQPVQRSLASAILYSIVLVIVILIGISATAFQFNARDGALRTYSDDNFFIMVYKKAMSIIVLSTLTGLIIFVLYYCIEAWYLIIAQA